MKQHQVIWLTRRPAQERAEELLRFGYQISFCESVDQILKIFEKKRTGVIIISDDLEYGYSWIETLTHHPETRASKFILSLEQKNSGLYDFAASHSFRDLLPFDLSHKVWAQRFIFAASTMAMDPHVPQNILGVHQVAKLNLPARVIWVSSDMICLESQIQPPEGTVIRIGGALAQQFGMKVITGTVHRIQHRHLYYRFSTSILIHWRCPNTPIAKQALHQMHQKDLGKKSRVLLVMGSAHNRRILANRLDAKFYETHSLLRMQRLVQEVHFLSPHAIFIDASLCQKPEFEQMLNVLDHDTPIFVLGSPQDAGIDSSQMTFLRHIPANPGALFNNETTNQVKTKYEAIYLQSDDPASFAKVIVPTHLTGVHPEYVDFLLPFKVNAFALAQVVTPFLSTTHQNGLWLKITEIENDRGHNKKMPYKAQAHLADLSAREQYTLGTKLIQHYEEQLRYHWEQPSDLSLPDPIKPTPIKRKVIKARPRLDDQLPKNLKHLLTFLLINLIAYALFSWAVPYLTENFKRSGSVYTDQIRKFQDRRPKPQTPQ